MSSPQQTPAYSEPGYAKSGRNKGEYPWYLQSIDKHLLPETRQLLETYSKVPRDQQSQHVHEIRDQAWAIRSYPCTGLGVWLVPFISRSPAYPTILQRLRSSATFMDVGCFLGGDMRRLVFDGAPSANLYGVDIVSHWDVGYALYRDRVRFDAHFIQADILSSEKNPALQALKGRVDIISISAVMHQWGWKDQLEAAKKLVAFTRSGALVVGYQIGNVEAKEVINPTLKVLQWRHNPVSFAKMWNQVGAETGSMWEAQAWLRSWEDMGWDPADQAWLEPGDAVIDFVVTRIH
ncbi:hypothetical protein N7474_010680 [Penicillium riverlandense]|uniref:uncharacterized protein n=1 Tax=Penicillium riverlandense TaxID=1903569 RepID=UPI002547E4B7|nr:uncharacterized protein N7474_010680 [Penicillium riverlandense]KAJ5807088.1 hypothetical protein N7474_010680 [Penicillium riverlandense]